MGQRDATPPQLRAVRIAAVIQLLADYQKTRPRSGSEKQPLAAPEIERSTGDTVHGTVDVRRMCSRDHALGLVRASPTRQRHGRARGAPATACALEWGPAHR